MIIRSSGTGGAVLSGGNEVNVTPLLFLLSNIDINKNDDEHNSSDPPIYIIQQVPEPYPKSLTLFSW